MRKTNSKRVGRVEILDGTGVLRLLRREIKNAGSTALWATKAGLDPWTVRHVLAGRRSPSRSVIKALGLEVVYRRRRLAHSTRPRRKARRAPRRV
jgi:hypothetical protein